MKKKKQIDQNDQIEKEKEKVFSTINYEIVHPESLITIDNIILLLKD
jgi:hypothetical protein